MMPTKSDKTANGIKQKQTKTMLGHISIINQIHFTLNFMSSQLVNRATDLQDNQTNYKAERNAKSGEWEETLE